MRTIYLITVLILFLIVTISEKAYADTFKIMVSPITTDFYLEDINGNVSGYYPPSGFIVGELRYLDNYIVNGESTTEENSTSNEQWHELNPNGDKIIPPGRYKLVVSSMNITSATKIAVQIYHHYGNMPSGDYTGIVDYIFPGLTYTYEFNLPLQKTPGVNLIKVANSQDLIKDINALSLSNYIGNTKFVTELIKDINEVEKERAKGKVDDGMTPAQKAKKEYTELLSEITEKYNKPENDEFIKQEAYIILRKDIEYIINHIQ